MLIEQLDRELHLTDEQKVRVQSIFDGRRPHLEAIQREMATRASDEQRELQAEIRKVLTPDQQVRFDQWLEQQPRGRRGRPRSDEASRWEVTSGALVNEARNRWSNRPGWRERLIRPSRIGAASDEGGRGWQVSVHVCGSVSPSQSCR